MMCILTQGKQQFPKIYWNGSDQGCPLLLILLNHNDQEILKGRLRNNNFDCQTMLGFHSQELPTNYQSSLPAAMNFGVVNNYGCVVICFHV